MLNLAKNEFKKTTTCIPNLVDAKSVDSELNAAKLNLAFANVSAQDFLWTLFNRAFQVEGKIRKKDGCNAVYKIFNDEIVSPEIYLSFVELAESQSQAMKHLFSDEASDSVLEYRLGSILMIVQLFKGTTSEIEKEMLEGLVELWDEYLTETNSLRIFPIARLKSNGEIRAYSMSWSDFDWFRHILWNEKEKIWQLADSDECEIDGTNY